MTDETITPKQAYERRRAEREMRMAESEKRYGQRQAIFDKEDNAVLDLADRFVTAIERLADALDRTRA